jgi:hypothetical protein
MVCFASFFSDGLFPSFYATSGKCWHAMEFGSWYQGLQIWSCMPVIIPVLPFFQIISELELPVGEDQIVAQCRYRSN